MSDKYHQERSRLIQHHKEEIKSIEKEIKSKKGILKENYQKRLEETLKRQEEELKEFESKYNKNEEKHKKNDKSNNNSSLKPKESNQNYKEVIFEEKQWNSLSKSELEIECKTRGLNSKGSKEDLVTRLFIFTADQKSKINKEDGNLDKVNNHLNNNFNETLLKTSNSKILPPEINFSNSGGTGKKKTKFQNRKIDHRKNINSNQNSWAAFCARNDIPRKKNSELNIHEDSNSDSDLTENNEPTNENNHPSIDESKSEDEVDQEKLVKRNKRRAVMVKVLEKMFSNMDLNQKKNGIQLSEIENHLTKLNVKNFRPELLGYKSTEDWILSQPKSLITYDDKNKMIFPPGYKIPSSSKKFNSKDDPYLIDSLSETSENDYFM